MKLVPAIFSICLILTASCRQNKTFHSIDSFQGSRVWALAKLVQSEDTVKMSEFVNSNPSIDIDEVDSKYHKNLLIWSIFNGHYKSTKALLRLGANPNFTAFDGTTPLIYASKYLSSNYKTDIRYIAALLQFGADPNRITTDSVMGLERDALNAAAVTSIEYVKYLIEKGNADPFMSVNHISPIEQAVIQNKLEIVDYLISSSNVSLHIPSGTYGGGKTVYNILNDKEYPSGSHLYLLQQNTLTYNGGFAIWQKSHFDNIKAISAELTPANVMNWNGPIGQLKKAIINPLGVDALFVTEFYGGAGTAERSADLMDIIARLKKGDRLYIGAILGYHN